MFCEERLAERLPRLLKGSKLSSCASFLMSGWLAPRGMEVAFNTGAENLSDPPNKSERFPDAAAADAAAGGGLEAAAGGGTLLEAGGPPRSARKSKVFLALTSGVVASSRLMFDFSWTGGCEAGNPNMSDSCLEDPLSDSPRRSTVEDGEAEEDVLISGVELAVTELSCSLLRSGLLT